MFYGAGWVAPTRRNASAIARMQRASSVKRKRPHADTPHGAHLSSSGVAEGREGAGEEEEEDLKPLIAEGGSWKGELGPSPGSCPC